MKEPRKMLNSMLKLKISSLRKPISKENYSFRLRNMPLKPQLLKIRLRLFQLNSNKSPQKLKLLETKCSELKLKLNKSHLKQSTK
jgi:hypothetical protein